MNDQPTPPPAGSEQVQQLTEQLAEAEWALQCLTSGSVDAALDRSSGELILLRRAQEAGIEAQVRYRRLVDRMAAIIFELDPAGITLFVNEAVITATGYQPEELIGRSWWDTFFPGPLRVQVDPLLEQLCATDVSAHELTVAARDGRYITLELTSANRYRPDGTLESILAFGLDVTRRKEAEERLRQQKEVLQTIFDHIPVMVDFLDSTGRLKLVNHNWERVLGWTLEEAQQRDILAELYPDPAYRQHVLNYILHPPAGWAEFKTRVRDGRVIDTSWANVLLSDGTSIGIGQDITARKRAEEALRASEQRSARLVETITDGIVLLDLQGRFTFANPAAERILGVPQQQLRQQDYHFWLPRAEAVGDQLSQSRPVKFEEVIQYGLTAQGQEFALTRPDGKVIFVTVNMAPLCGANEAVIGAVCSFTDITQRKLAEKALRASEERYRILFENANDILFTHDLKGNCTSLNKAGELLTGYSFAEIRHINIAQLVVPEHRNLLMEMLEHKLAYGGKTAYEVGLRTRDGRRVTVEVSTSLIYHDGLPVEVQGIARDVTERRLADERLRESERRFRETLENAQLAAVMLDQEGAIHFCNDYLLNLTHYQREEVVGQNWFDLFLPLSQKAQARNEYQAQVCQGTLPTYTEQALVTRRGERRLIAWNHTLLRDVGGAVIGTCRLGADVTESRNAEEALQLRDRALEAFSQGILITDPSQPDNPIIYANPAFERITGYAASEVLGQNCRLLQGPATDPATVALLREAISVGRETSVEILNYRRDGTPFWNLLSIFPVCDSQGRLTHFCGTQLDITERRQMSKALQESKERYRLLFENDLTGDYLATPAGQIVACNAAFVRILGFDSPDEIMRVNLSALYPDPRKLPDLVARLAEEKSLNHLELELRRRDGQLIPVIKTCVGIFDESGALVQVAGYVFDVTERRQLEDQLRQAQKMEAVGRLAGGVAHDFNNLLTVISGYSEILLGRLKPNDPQYEPIREIRKASDRAAGLTRQLLAFSRRQVLAPVVLNLNTVVQEMEKMLRRLIGEDIELRIGLDPDLGQVRADPGQIEQVLLNLVVNARDAMPTGGQLTIESGNTTLDAAFGQQHPDVRLGAYALLTVTDTGCGMDETTRARIFEPFFTTKEIGKGTGLGLAMVYGIIKQSGGHIDVVSAVGQGASFRIYLPLLKDPARAAGSEPGLYRIPGGSETVLLVEDEDGVRALARLILQASGYTVLEAANGREALRLVNQHTGPLHLLVADVVMPQMSGRQLADILLARRPEMKVLYISGYTDDAVVRHGVSGTTMPFLHKPFTPASLSRKVREILGS